jgi:kinesin family member 2/24
VDLDILCTPGMTALQFGRMYTTEFVERCLLARPNRGPNQDLRLDAAEAVKALAVEVSGIDIYMHFRNMLYANLTSQIINKLFYLTITAKTRTRNRIMKSRKVVVEDEAYGEEDHLTFDAFQFFSEP